MDNYPQYPHATGQVVALHDLDVHPFFTKTPPENWTPISFMLYADSQDVFDEFEAGLRKIHRAGGLDVHRFAGKCLRYVMLPMGHTFLEELQSQLDSTWATFQLKMSTDGTLQARWCMNDVKVEIAASDTGESFEDSKFDGRCAKTVQAPLQNLTEDSMCLIKLIVDREDEDEDEDGQDEIVEHDEISLPVKYLRPVEPTRKGCSVKVVVGEDRGKIGKLVGLGAKGAIVQLRGGGGFRFFRPKDLVEYVGYS